MTRRFLSLVIVLALACPVFAVGTVTMVGASVGLGVTRYDVAWTSNASGAVSGNAITVPAGSVVQVRVVPGTAGVQPTDLYDLTLVDSKNIDLLNGSGANLSNATGTYMVFNPPIFHDVTDTLDVVIANAGNAKSGAVAIWVREPSR